MAPVVFFENFDDPFQDNDCEYWGNIGRVGMPVITNDKEYFLFELFNSENCIPSNVIIAPDMTVSYMNAFEPFSEMQDHIDDLITEYGLENEVYEMGDLTQDHLINVQDLLIVVNIIIGILQPDFVEFQLTDMNEDDIVSVHDLILILNTIFNNRNENASYVKLEKNDHMLRMESDGFVGALEIVLSHEDNVEIELTDECLLGNYHTHGTKTKLIIVAPESNFLFTSSSEFTIESITAMNSKDRIEAVYPDNYIIKAAYPNPFNPTTTLRINLAKVSEVSIQILDLNGRVVTDLYSGLLKSGKHSFSWQAEDYPSGTYFIQSRIDNEIQTQKTILLK